MRLDILHVTTYHYHPSVSTAQHIAHLLPRKTAAQQVLSSRLEIHPAPENLKIYLDAFGNPTHYFALNAPHDKLVITAHSQVQTQRVDLLSVEDVAWESVRDAFHYRAATQWDDAQEFVFASPFVQPHDEFLNYARMSFTPGRSLLQASQELMSRIHRDFAYTSASTSIHTPALQAFHQRQGVCQDFAHILLCCLRSLGLAGRYISGYLLTQPPEGQPRLIGSDASHAWTSVYLPSGHWFDLDPTNDRCGWFSPGEDYATVAWGRDFGDVSPVRGVIYGGHNHQLDVAVTVSDV
jgi:transglutaminase-like putative cysteine protease